MEKTDHILIYLNTANNITQLSLLSIRNHRLLIVFLAWLTSLYAGYSILMRRKNVYHKLLCALPVTIAIPQMIQYMSSMEFSLFALAWGQTFLGAMAYVTQAPNIWPDTFGYHEVMHLLTSTAALTAIALQYHLLDSFHPSYCLLSGMTEGLWGSLFLR
jgi:hemolysin III